MSQIARRLPGTPMAEDGDAAAPASPSSSPGHHRAMGAISPVNDDASRSSSPGEHRAMGAVSHADGASCSGFSSPEVYDSTGAIREIGQQVRKGIKSAKRTTASFGAKIVRKAVIYCPFPFLYLRLLR